MGKRGKYCQYRTTKRFPKYTYRLVEGAFALDANVLARSGFFRGGRGSLWNYECRNAKYAYLGGAYLTLIDSETERGEHNILVDNPGFWGKQVIKIKHNTHPLVRTRYWLICSCKRRVAALYIPISKITEGPLA